MTFVTGTYVDGKGNGAKGKYDVYSFKFGEQIVFTPYIFTGRRRSISGFRAIPYSTGIIGFGI